MYTSLGKANDRFGFKQTGQFRCTYKNDRLFAIIGGVVVLLFAGLLVFNFIWLAGAFGSDGNIGSIVDTERLYDTAAQGGMMMNIFSSDFISVSATFIASGFGIFILSIFVALYILLLFILHRGKKYEFTANEERFIVTYPPNMHRTDAYKYEDVLGVTWKTYKFPLLPECYDITVSTRNRTYEYRVILNRLARVNGIIETPFNFIRERTGIADRDEVYMNRKI